MCVEIHALVIEKGAGSISVHGFDRNRLELILSTLKFYCPDIWDLAKADIFLKVPGGLEVAEATADLAVALLILATLRKHPTSHICALGEIELTGIVRQLPSERRKHEAESKGYLFFAPNGGSIDLLIRKFLEE